MNPDAIAKWVGIVTALWGVVSSILNALFWFKSPDEWVAFAEAQPRAAAAIRVVRAFGIDPKKGLIALRDLVAQGRRPPGSTTVRPPPNESAVPPPPPGALYLDPQTDRVERKDPPT